jgi:hypothetical protein
MSEYEVDSLSSMFSSATAVLSDVISLSKIGRKVKISESIRLDSSR